MGERDVLVKKAAKLFRIDRTESTLKASPRQRPSSQSWVSIRQSMEQYQCCHAVTPTLLTMLLFCRLDSFPRATITYAHLTTAIPPRLKASTSSNFWLWSVYSLLGKVDWTMKARLRVSADALRANW